MKIYANYWQTNICKRQSEWLKPTIEIGRVQPVIQWTFSECQAITKSIAVWAQESLYIFRVREMLFSPQRQARRKPFHNRNSILRGSYLQFSKCYVDENTTIQFSVKISTNF